MSYFTSKAVNAKFLGHLAWHIGKCGGVGGDDFAVDPASDMGYARIKLLSGRDFDDPELCYVSTPMYDKKNNQQAENRVPTHLPSRIFGAQFKDFQEPIELTEPAEEIARLDCPRWREHRVRQRVMSSHHWSRIVPAALYQDGVHFQNRDNFFTICVRDLRTNVSHVSIILR